MSDNVFLFFNGWGILGLAVFTLAYASSHFLAIKGLITLELCSKVIGFIALISICIFSGWKAGLVALPIALVGSFIGEAIAGGSRKE